MLNLYRGLFSSFCFYLNNNKFMICTFIFVVGSSIINHWLDLEHICSKLEKQCSEKLTIQAELRSICFSINFELSSFLFPAKIRMTVSK